MDHRYYLLPGFSDLPGWKFGGTEVALYVYEVLAWDGHGHVVRVVGRDPSEKLINMCRRMALAVQAGKPGR